jgi:hypothetical protein
MADELSGEYWPGRDYIDMNVRLLSESVLSIIEDLNALSNDKYPLKI